MRSCLIVLVLFVAFIVNAKSPFVWTTVKPATVQKTGLKAFISSPTIRPITYRATLNDTNWQVDMQNGFCWTISTTTNAINETPSWKVIAVLTAANDLVLGKFTNTLTITNDSQLKLIRYQLWYTPLYVTGNN